MNILHVIEDYSIESGGLRTVIKNLNYFLNKNGHKSYILSSKKEANDTIFLVETSKPWLFSNNWQKQLKIIVKEFNIKVIHIHGVWLHPQYAAAKFCINNKIPFILSPHGMYEPWLWDKGTIKKKIYFNFFAKKVLEQAQFIHAITPQEKLNIKKLFKTNTVFEIPNLIDDEFTLNTYAKNIDEKYILFLGRLHEVKGLDILFKAFSKINDSRYKLKIAGKINDYYPYLKQLSEELDIHNKIEFLDMVKGDKKIELIKNAVALVAPSYSEVIGMVNLEAAIQKTLVVTTHQTGLNPLWSKNGGILINPNEKELTNALKTVIKYTDIEIIKNGEQLHKFVSEHYSWSNRFKDWENIYNSCK